MSDTANRELEQVARIFVNLGAPEAQAQVMAAQLLKRAAQIAEERQISKIEATETLLKQVVEARRGA
jgi:hypothetical protein